MPRWQGRQHRIFTCLCVLLALTACMAESAPRDRIRASLPKPEATLQSKLSIPQQRAAWEEHMMLGFKMPDDVSVADVQVGVPGVMVTLRDRPSAPLILFAHGGGFVVGSPKTHLGLAIRLARASGSRVLLVDYRLAPENQYPAARDDFVAAYRAAVAHGESPRRIVLAGDSSGGHVVLSSLIELHQAKVALPAAAVLMSPWLDLAQRGESIQTRASSDPLLLSFDLDDCARLYLGPHSPLSPGVDVLAADARVYPPLLVQVGDDEILLSDSTRLTDAIQQTGGSVRLKIWPELWHVFQMWAPQLPEANQAIGEIGDFIAEQVHAALPAR